MINHTQRTLAWICLMLGAGAAVLGPHTLPAFAADKATQRLKILSYNIHHGEGTDGSVDLERLAEVIRKADSDLVTLQEVDDRTQRTGRVDQTARLAELTGLKGRFAKQIDYEGGGYGQAFLSRFPISDVTVQWLPGRPDRERRIAASAEINLGERKLTFVSTHLHHNNEGFRREQATALNTLFADPAQAVILTGDLNATPDSVPLSILDTHWKSASAGETPVLTFPAVDPQRQLDYVLYRPADRFRVIAVKVIDEPLASDHRPLLVELEF